MVVKKTDETLSSQLTKVGKVAVNEAIPVHKYYTYYVYPGSPSICTDQMCCIG